MTIRRTMQHGLHGGFFLVAMSVAGVRAQNVAIPLMSDMTAKTPAADVKVPDFDVVSVKPNKSDTHMIRMMNTPDGISMSNVTLKMLIANAYGIRQDLISGGPGWVESDHFDFDAKVAGADVETFKKLNRDQRRAMLIPVLEERFKLKLHSETKVVPVYELTVAKGGPKVKETPVVPVETKPGDAPSAGPGRKMNTFTLGSGHFQLSGAPMSVLANQLSSVEQRSVIDKTGLTGNYDVDLTWTPDDAPVGGGSDTETGPSLFTALQEQLGLKLEAGKAPVESLVIDQVEMASQN